MGFLTVIQRSLQVIRNGKRQSSDIIILGAIPPYRRELLYFSDKAQLGIRVPIIEVSLNSNAPATEETTTNDPSTIYITLPVASHTVLPESAPRLPYFPTYAGMSAEQRSIYLHWLRDITTQIEIGYVFIYYYGLERQLIYGNFDGAIKEIVLLRKHHDNRSFQSYSSTALVHACFLRRRIDTLLELYKDCKFDYFGSLNILALYYQGLDIMPDVLMRLAEYFKGISRLYVKKYPDIYSSALRLVLMERFGKESYPFFHKYYLNDVKWSPFPVFANISFPSEIRTPLLPDFLNHAPFKCELEEFFRCVYEKAKLLRRKNSKLTISNNKEVKKLVPSRKKEYRPPKVPVIKQ